MRITIEPTGQHDHLGPECVNCTVTVEHPCDDLTMTHAFRLCADALKAYGFDAASVDRFMEGEQ